MDSLLKMEDRTAPVDSTENAQWRDRLSPGSCRTRNREGSRPRGPLFSKPTTDPIQR